MPLRNIGASINEYHQFSKSKNGKLDNDGDGSEMLIEAE